MHRSRTTWICGLSVSCFAAIASVEVAKAQGDGAPLAPDVQNQLLNLKHHAEPLGYWLGRRKALSSK